MKNVEEIFKILSREKKTLKPEHAYKSAEEGILRAMYFFRWCNKKNIKNPDKIVDMFVKGTVPEKQTEHYATALVMIDHYDTDPEVKDVIRYINEKVKEKTGKEVIENIEEGKVQRRILKNIYSTFHSSVCRLKKRAEKLRKSFLWFWVSAAVLLVLNVALSITGIYQQAVNSIFPPDSASLFIQKYGGFIVAVVLFVMPLLLLGYFNRHKLSEHGKKSSDYPEEIREMEETLSRFKQKIQEKNVNVK